MTDSFKLARLSEIQAQKDRSAERMRQLRQEMKNIEAAEIALHEQFIRAQNFDPGQGTCPRCGIDEAVTSRLIVLAGTSNRGLARRCPRCSWTEVADQAALAP